MEAELWTTVINGSANLVIAGAMLIQTIIFLATFKFGFKYLDQHKDKIRVEKNADLSVEIINGLNEMNLLIESYFRGIDVYNLNEFINKNSPFEVPNEFVKNYAKFSIINKNIEKSLDDINSLYSQIEVWVAFLKDYDLRVVLRQLKLIHIEILEEIDNNFDKIKEESDYFLSQYNPDQRREYVKKKKVEFENFTPRSFFNSNVKALEKFNVQLYDLKELIIEKHIP